MGVRRPVAGLTGLVLLLAGAVVLSVLVGANPVPARVVWHALTVFDPADPDQLAVRTLRLPRTAVGLLAGAALGLAGAVMQGVARNPLADPGILGVNSGAALGLVLGIAALGGTGSLVQYVWFGFAGAALAAAVVYVVGAQGRDGATPVKLALAGAAVTAAVSSLVTGILVLDATAFGQYRFFEIGSLAGRGGDVLAQAWPFVLAGAALSLGSGRALNTLSLGTDTAVALGQRVGLVRANSVLAIVLLCGTATAMAGPIVFVGLAVPHLARVITGPDYRWVLPYSMVLAPALLLFADVLGRLAGELQVGTITAVLGAPVFIALVRRRRLAEL